MTQNVHTYTHTHTSCNYLLLDIGFIHLTCPGLCGAVFATLVEDSVEDHQQQEGGVVSEDSLGAAELSVIDHVQPGAEQQDPAHTVKGGLQKEEHHVDEGEGALLCPVPVYNC